MNFACCNCRCNCTAVSLVTSVIVGVIAAFLQITGVITLTPMFLLVAAGIAVAYLGGLTLAALVDRRRERGRCICSGLNVLLVALLGTILLSAVLLAVGITATSVISAILVGLLIAFVTLAIAVSACLVRYLADCAE